MKHYCGFCEKETKHYPTGNNFKKKKAQEALVGYDERIGIKPSPVASYGPETVDGLSAKEMRCNNCGTIIMVEKTKRYPSASDLARGRN